jgi:carboxymethylenebutenolidase
MSGAAITKEKVELTVGDGTLMGAYVARPNDSGTHPGLLVFQEAFGVNHHIRDVTERFAAEGYVAIAPELFHRTAPPGFEVSYTDFPSVMPHMQAVTTETAEADVRAAHDWLGSSGAVKAGEILCVGFCMGGARRFRSMEEESHLDCSTGRRSCRPHPYLYGADWTSTLRRNIGEQ